MPSSSSLICFFSFPLLLGSGGGASSSISLEETLKCSFEALGTTRGGVLDFFGSGLGLIGGFAFILSVGFRFEGAFGLDVANRVGCSIFFRCLKSGSFLADIGSRVLLSIETSLNFCLKEDTKFPESLVALLNSGLACFNFSDASLRTEALFTGTTGGLVFLLPDIETR